MTFTFKGDDLGKSFFALETDLPNVCLVVELGVVESLVPSTTMYKVMNVEDSYLILRLN